jgi:hypothetical protein
MDSTTVSVTPRQAKTLHKPAIGLGLKRRPLRLGGLCVRDRKNCLSLSQSSQRRRETLLL